jgi:nicotinamide-nucleotide amidase
MLTDIFDNRHNVGFPLIIIGKFDAGLYGIRPCIVRLEKSGKIMDHELTARAHALVQALKAAGLMMATAESCTGGWIAQCMTAIPGSSVCFDAGFVTYSNTAKQRMLGVEENTLMQHGAVSREVVEEMARGALTRSSAQVSVAVSGIAGPDGGTPNKPVGTVWIAWANGERLRSDCFHFQGDREAVRYQTVIVALMGMQKNIV